MGMEKKTSITTDGYNIYVKYNIYISLFFVGWGTLYVQRPFFLTRKLKEIGCLKKSKDKRPIQNSGGKQ